MATLGNDASAGIERTAIATEQLRALFVAKYSSTQLCGLDSATFFAHIHSLIGGIDAAGEGYLDPSKQRDLSVKYHWGHNHSFGNGVELQGRMADRHIEILARFVSGFEMPLDLSGKKVLDIGVWTGGTSLLLAAMGANVVALEEVKKYADTVNFLARAFGVSDRLTCIPKTLYEVLPLFADDFDYVVYSGVIYHVTDPLLSLRLVFSALKNGGAAFIETFGFDSPENVCRYEGPSVTHIGSKEQLTRSGWNYFIPSAGCLKAWCLDAGFQSVRVDDVTKDRRLLGAAIRTGFQDFCRAGISCSTVR